MVSPFGEFDYELGGHLILHDLHVILEVPSGSIVFFPSALITHENIPVQGHETRRAITGYSSASLFQFADNGFLPASTIVPDENQTGDKIWLDGLLCFPNIEEYL